MAKKKLTKAEKTQERRQRNRLNWAKQDRKWGLVCIVLGIALILFFGNRWMNQNDEIKPEQLITIKGTVTNTLEVKSKKSVGNSMIIRLQEYPTIDYKIGRWGISGLNVMALQQDIDTGNKIQLGILEEDYLTIDPNQEKTIAVYELSGDRRKFLSLDAYNHAKKEDQNSIAMYLILGFNCWLLGYGIYLVVKYQKKLGDLPYDK